MAPSPRLRLLIACLAPLCGAASCKPPVAQFFPDTGLLRVTGTVEADTYVVSRTETGAIVVNGGAVPIRGGVPTIANTTRIELLGRGGNDHLALDESGPLPPALLDGGIDDDVLIGGAGDDQLHGGAGSDAILWHAGGGADQVDGGPGADSLRVIGSFEADDLSVAAGPNALLQIEDRVAGLLLTSTAVEHLVLDTGAGDDQVLFADLSEPRPVEQIEILAGDGDDRIDATQLADPPLRVFAGGGDDVVLGSAGDDEVRGGDGHDWLDLGAGDDTAVWLPGDDGDEVEGGGGFDTYLFQGANTCENVRISATDGGRIELFRDVSSVTAILAGIESLELRVRGGADTVLLNDVTGLGLVQVDVDLSGTTDPEGATDTIFAMGTDGADVIHVIGDASGTSVSGLGALLHVRGGEALVDRLSLDLLAGDDVLDATNLAADALLLVANGGADHDVLLGGEGPDVLLGGAGDDVLMGGPGLDVLDGGPGDDVEIQ